jgi:hypothetical protein
MMLELLASTLEFALPVLVTIFLGLFLAGFLVEMGLLQPLSALSRPMVAVAHLPEVCATSFVVSLGSTIAANGMVARFRQDRLLERREVFLCALMNAIPAYIREIFTYQIPIVVPALGLVAGGLYALVFIVTGVVKVMVVIILGRIFFSSRTYGPVNSARPRGVSARAAAIKVLRGQARLFSRIAVLYLLMTFLIFFLRSRGFFEYFQVLPLAGLFGLPPEVLVPLTTYVASPILGISLLGPMIHSGAISDLQALVVLMLGSMFMLPIFALRSMVPNYTALFGPRLGLSVVAFSTAISVLVRLTFLLLFLRLA